MPITIQETLNALKSTVGNISNFSDDQYLEWANTVNQELYEITKTVNASQEMSEETINVTAGTSAYNLPSGFQDIRETKTGVFEVDQNGSLITPSLIRTQRNSIQRGYYLTNTQIVFTPTPTKATTIKLRYIPTLAEMTALTDEYFVDDTRGNRKLIKIGLMVEFYIEDEDLGREQAADQRYRLLLQDFEQKISVTSKAINLIDKSNYL